jgi:hypothetical protein
LLFNLVVDAILRLTDEVKPALKDSVQKIFYADDGRTAGEDPMSIQEVHDFIGDCFERVGLLVNTKKTVTMTNAIQFRSLRKNQGAVLRAQLRRPEYQKRWVEWTACPECGKIVQNRSLRRHCTHVHPDKPETHVHPVLWSPEMARGQRGVEYEAFWDVVDGVQCRIACPDPSCTSTCFQKPSDLRSHWATAMHEGTLVIYDNRGDTPVELKARHQCNKCMVWRTDPVTQRHFESRFCQDISERRKAINRQAQHKAEADRSPFKHNSTGLTKVNHFQYLGRMLTATNDDTLAVQRNTGKAKQKWAEIRRILHCKPVLPRTFVRFYKAIVLNVLLYGSETWKLTGQTLANLEAFHNKCVRTICKQPIQLIATDGNDGVQHWSRPSIAPLLAKTKLKTVTEYINIRKDNLNGSYNGKQPHQRCDTTGRSYLAKRKLFL